MVTAAEVLSQAEALPRHEAERLLLAAGGLTRIGLLLGGELDAGTVARFEELVAARVAGRPLQYLEGTVQFGPLDLAVDDRALIPRPETEQLWELVVATVGRPPAVVVDLGTGSGNLALACKHTWPSAAVYAVELSAAAASLARENARRTGLTVEVCEGDLFTALPGRLSGTVDLIISNPPYIATGELAGLPGDVRDHEPATALVAGPRGDEILVEIAEGAVDWLRPGGIVACEISEFGADAVAALFAGYGAEVRRDLAGKPRFLIGRMPG